MLFNPSTKRNEVYIGKTTNISTRMKNHTASKDPESWWSVEIVFTINDSTDPMNECTISYLEYLMCENVRKSINYNLYQDVEEHQGQSPQKPKVSKSSQLYFNVLFKDIDILSKSLGFDVFLNADSTHELFRVKRNNKYYGGVKYIDNKIFILKGSHMYEKGNFDTFKDSRNYKIYKRWIDEKIIKNDIFIKDKECTSPSEASSLLLKSKSSNGWSELRRKGDDRTLNDIYRNK